MVPTSWSARLLPPQLSPSFLTTLDQAFQATGLTRAPAVWFGSRGHPDFVMGQDVFERAARQDDDRITLAYAFAGFSTTTAFLARTWLESSAGLVTHLELWTPVLNFSPTGGMPPESSVLERLSEAVVQGFASEGQSPLVEVELNRTHLGPDHVREWADAHIQQKSLNEPWLETLRLIPAGHRNDAQQTIGDCWVARYASKGADGAEMTVVHIEDKTGELTVG